MANATHDFKTGDAVHWSWGNGTAHGKVTHRFEKRVQRRIKGKAISRVGTPDNPAFLIEQADGDKVLKRGSELTKG